MQPVWIFRHIECEGPGYLAEVLDRYRIPYRLIAVDQHLDIPTSPDDASALVFMGGPMSVNDDHIWIKQELTLIQQAHAGNIPMLGHCLGAQLISKALGSVIRANPVKEVGWLPVRKTGNNFEALPAEFEVFHWHGETFEWPADAVPIAKSTYCSNQAYLLRGILAIQFHIEVTAEMVRQWIDLYPHDIAEISGSVQSAEQMQQNLETRCDHLHQIADVFYRYWLTQNGLIRR